MKKFFIIGMLFVLIAVPVVTRSAMRLAEADEDEREDQQEERTEQIQPSLPVVSPQVTPIAPVTDTVEVPETTQTNTQTPETVPEMTTSVPADTTNQNTNQAPAMQTVKPALSPSFPWPWVISRGAGIASFILLTLMTITGMLITTGLLFRIWEPSTAWSVHRAIATTLLLSVVVHLSGFLFDTFIDLKIQDLLIPFVSTYKPLFVTYGIVGFYLLLLLLATSLYTMAKHSRFWRIVHYSGFIMYAAVFLHALLIGTDSKYLWMKIILWASAVIIVLLSVYRVIWKHRAEPIVEPAPLNSD